MAVPIYVVSLLKDKERRKKISDDFKKIDIDFSFYDAIDAKCSENKTLIEEVRLSGGDAAEMSDGEIACALSHRSVYHDILIKNHNWAIILEDDVIIDDQLGYFFDLLNSEKINKLNNDDLYILGGQKGLHDYPVIATSLFTFVDFGKIKLRRVTYNQHKIRRTCSYLISQEMCGKILNLAKKDGIFRADDWKRMKRNGVINNFFLSEIIEHPIVCELNSHLEAERNLRTINKKSLRSKVNLFLKKSRAWLRTFFFSFSA